MYSVPTFFRRKGLATAFPHPLRMTNGLMASLADADQVTLAHTISVCEIFIQRKLRPTLYVIDVMHQFGPSISTPGLAELALISVRP